MICFVEGILVEKQPTRAVLSVGGVGYEVLIPLSSYDRLPKVNAACRIEVVDYVREDQHTLFGFMSQGEREMFMMLVSISGIGPKLALSALSGLSVREITAAVVEGDPKRLNAISGVGRKMAERMIVELRDKLTDGERLGAIAGDGDEGLDRRTRDAVLALVSLGYKEGDARNRIRAVLKAQPDGMPIEEVIRLALAG